MRALLERAMRLHRDGRLAEAASLYREILRAQPLDFDAANLLGNIYLREGKSDDALAVLAAALAVNPHSLEARMNLGYALSQQDRLDEAVESFRQAVGIRPDFAEAHRAIGMLCAELDRPDEAVSSYRRAIELEPENAQGHNNLGIALARLGRLDDAVASYRRAIALDAATAEAHNNLGVALSRLDRDPEALASFRRAVALAPDFAEAHNNLGNTLGKLGEAAAALASYRRAVELRPDYVDAFNNLGFAQLKQHQLETASVSFRRALAAAPDSAVSHNGLGIALTQTGRVDEAMGHYRQALALEPHFAEAHNNLGTAFKMLGRIDEARRTIERAIEIDPKNAEFYFNLSEAKRAAAGDPHLDAMERLAAAVPPLPAEARIYLHFALGKAYADLGRHARSFAELLAGNVLKRRQVAYDEAAVLNRFERTRAVFNPALMRAKQGLGHPSKVPLFVLGMPRSGTTLVEQILASHPAVFGAGERAEFGHIATRLGGPNAALRFPEAAITLSAAELGALGARYLDQLRRLAPQAPHITDKMPANFRFAGLIHLALPNARIVHIRRNPIDTCLSCFSLLFSGDQPHTYDLAELGRYYRAYEALMAHWRAVLPPQVMLDVDYEEVVADLETTARRIVAHCGLDWDESCLDFHKTERAVQTASLVQVRRPIYSGSIGRWRPYKEALGPLFAVLGLDPEGNPPAG